MRPNLNTSSQAYNIFIITNSITPFIGLKILSVPEKMNLYFTKSPIRPITKTSLIIKYKLQTITLNKLFSYRLNKF